MVEFSISEFKAKCRALLERVRKTKQPLRVTRHGKPVAGIIPHPQQWIATPGLARSGERWKSK